MDILAQAFDLGLVTRGEVERGLVAGRPGDGPGQVSISVRGRIVATVHEVGVGTAGAQARGALWALAQEDLGPAVLPSTDGRLWTAPVPGRSLTEIAAAEQGAASAARSTLTESTAACVALGAGLAAVHRLPARPGEVSQAARAIDRVRRDRETSLGSEIQHAVDTDRGIQAAAETVRRRWSERNWTLGRIEPDGVLMDSFHFVRFTDLRSAGLGNPDWDIAACLASIARVAGRRIPGGAATCSAAWLGEHFWNSYRRAGGPGQVHPHMQAMYAIDAAWRVAGAGERTDRVAEDVHWWLARAHRVVARPALPGLAA